jgi:hypothetical protein
MLALVAKVAISAVIVVMFMCFFFLMDSVAALFGVIKIRSWQKKHPLFVEISQNDRDIFMVTYNRLKRALELGH